MQKYEKWKNKFLVNFIKLRLHAYESEELMSTSGKSFSPPIFEHDLLKTGALQMKYGLRTHYLEHCIESMSRHVYSSRIENSFDRRRTENEACSDERIFYFWIGPNPKHSSDDVI